MNRSLATLASRHAGRPLLLTPRAAEDVVRRIRAVDERAFARPSRLQALLSKLAGGRPQAMDDDEGYEPIPMEQRLAYSPLYAGEPEDLGYCWTLSQGVALMQADTILLDRGWEFCGEVYHGYDTLLAGMQEAAADERVRAIFLRLSSPGGVVAGGLPELAAWIRDSRAAAGGKPIWVYADMACSAAYWIAGQADRILAPAVGLVGSIGAVLVHEDWSEALAKEGVAITAIQFGEHKTDGAFWSKLSPAAKAALQAEIDQCGRDFVGDLVAGRAALTEQAALDTQAAVFMARHDEPERSGLQLNLVDDIAFESEAFAELVDHVSPAGQAARSTPQASGTSGAAATGGRGAETPAKEQPMAVKAPTQPGPSAALQAAKAAKRAVEAEIARLTAQSNQAATPADDDAEDATDGGADEDMEEGKKPDATPASTEAKSEAEKIAASPLAQAEPALAMAAITSGQTLAQFEASAAALKSRPKGGALREAMANQPRLGPDAGGDKAKAQIDTRGVYARRAKQQGRGARA